MQKKRKRKVRNEMYALKCNDVFESVKMKVGNKSTPMLEPEQTHVLEKEKIEESQKGPVTITVNCKEHTVVKELSEFTDKIGQHKDVKVELTVVDKKVLKPAEISHMVDIKTKDKEYYHKQTITQDGNQTCVSETLGFREHDTVYVSQVKTCHVAQNTPHHIKEVDDKTQIEVLKNLTNNFYVGSVGLPSALAARDLLSKPNRLILIDHFLNSGWDGKFEVSPAKTGGQLLTLKGYASAREHLNMTRIKASNAKVGTLGIAVDAAAGEKAALAEASGVFGAGSKVNILFVLGFETTKWFLSEDHWNNKSDLLVGLGTTTAKFAVAGVAAATIVGGVVAAAASSGVLIGAGVVVGTVILGALGIGILLDIADEHWGITDSLKKGWNEHVEKPIEQAIDKYNKEHPVDPHKYISDVPAWLLH